MSIKLKPGDKVVCVKKFVNADCETPVVGEICTVSDAYLPWEYDGDTLFCLENYEGSWSMMNFQKHIPKEKLDENADLWDLMSEDE